MLPVTELWIFQILHLSTQPNPVLPQNKHDTTNHILEDHWTKCRLWVPHRASLIQLINIHKRGRSPDFRPELQVFNEIHWPQLDTSIVHKSPMRVNEIHSPVLFRFESTTGLGHTYEFQYSLPIPLNPKPSDQSFNRRPLMRFMRVTYPNPPIG